MDKRTLIFVISLTFTLYAVNMFFFQRDRESKKQWVEQQKVSLQQKREELNTEINEKTAKPENFPIVNLYSDSQQTQFLTSGVKANDSSVITLAWDKELPEKVYINNAEFKLTYSPDEIGGPALYEKRTEDALPIGSLPYLGNYELQLITFYPEQPQKPPLVTLGKYVDGQFSIPIIKWIELTKKLGDDKALEGIILPDNALVLMNTPQGYLPVATYQSETKSSTYLEQISELRTELAKPKKDTVIPQKEEKFYVLENGYQQLVFSNKGGALVEINLPFESESDESVVKEIDFDREIVADHPYNALFPSNPYLTPSHSPQGPFVENPKGKLGGYYPLLRRDLIHAGNQKSIRILPQYYALNIVSEYPEMAELVYEVTHFDNKTIVFETTQRNRHITKRYTFNKEQKGAPYSLNLSIKIEGDSRGLWLTSGIPEVEWISNAPAPALKYRITRQGKPEIKELAKPEKPVKDGSKSLDWICNSNGFFGVILDPLSEMDTGYMIDPVPGTVAPSRLIQIDEEYERFKIQSLPGYLTMLPLNSSGGTMNFRIYAGPFASKTLKYVDQVFSDSATGYNPDYIAAQTYHGWFTFISAPFSKFLFILMRFFYFLTDSWAISIILLTVALRLMLYPLTAWSTKSMLKMQQITPEVQKIQEKYKKDPKKVQLEIMNLYRDRGVNPVSGCFPLLIQMPFLFGMFDLLKSTFELRGAPFIPGWIDNLAAPDVLFSWSHPIIFIGTQFHLLPILLGGVMFLQQKMMSTLPKDQSQLTDQQRQQKMMGYMMTVVFSVMFYHFPSGLNIYWLSSMLLGILQQWLTQKRFKAKAATAQLVTEPVKSEGRRRRRK
ncbi:MAG: membrane protein insertase YidC [Waddliaceae bacterium]